MYNLLRLGMQRIDNFCSANKLNNIPIPKVTEVPSKEWHYSPCAYYRPKEGIKICLNKCARLAPEQRGRNWNWPGSTTDREPYGVLCHELGHHADWHMGHNRMAYFSEYSSSVYQESGGEKCISSYCEQYHEWFAEMFRLFVTNHALLKILKPQTHRTLIKRGWVPVSDDNWEREVRIVEPAPQRIIDNLKKKIDTAPDPNKRTRTPTIHTPLFE